MHHERHALFPNIFLFHLLFALLVMTTTSTISTSINVKDNIGNTNLNAPCRLFIWDLPSAVRYHVCKNLSRDRIYEGIGGKKFIRIKPNSILESLYPCSSHSPSRCVKCRLSFQEHLQYWWGPHLSSPYGKWLNQTYQEALNHVEKNSDQELLRHSREMYRQILTTGEPFILDNDPTEWTKAKAKSLRNSKTLRDMQKIHCRTRKQKINSLRPVQEETSKSLSFYLRYFSGGEHSDRITSYATSQSFINPLLVVVKSITLEKFMDALQLNIAENRRRAFSSSSACCI